MIRLVFCDGNDGIVWQRRVIRWVRVGAVKCTRFSRRLLAAGGSATAED